MLENPTVAILIATYNGEKFLKQQLDSILQQTYQNFKIYVCDDNSSDSTSKILKEYQLTYSDKITYNINAKNIGFIKNFENLIKGCTEKYIALSDQDDIWIETKLEIQMNELLSLEALKASAYLIHSDLSVIDKNNNLTHNSYFKYRGYKLNNTKDFGHILGPSGVMGNTILFNNALKKIVLPFPAKLDVHDYWIGINCELFGVRKTIDLQLVKYRIHDSNSSNSINNLSKKKSLYLDRDIRLPNLETNRKYFLPELYKNIESVNDTKILTAYLKYLNFNQNRLLTYRELIKYSLVKRSYLFRIKLFFKILFTNRYQ